MRIASCRIAGIVGLWLGLQVAGWAQVPAVPASQPQAAVSAPAAAVAAVPVPAAAPALAAAPDPKAAASAPPPPPITHPSIVNSDTLNGADTAWMLTSTALVLMMTLPGIALFYAGMVRRKSVLNTMACVVAMCSLVSLLWFVAGYSWAFTPGSGFIGSSAKACSF